MLCSGKGTSNLSFAFLNSSQNVFLFFSYIESIYREGGLAALFVGSVARVAWLLPFTTIYLGVYETLKRKLSERKNVSPPTTVVELK